MFQLTLAPGATCTISVTFKPTYAGTRAANLLIPSNAGTTTVPLTGTGNKIPLTITAPTVSLLWTATLNPSTNASFIPTLNIPVFNVAPPDPAASFNLTCSASGYTVPGGPAGTYTSTCSAGTNPGNAYTLTFVTGKLTVTPTAATMISPAQGSQLAGPTVTFNWTTGGGKGPYVIWVSQNFGQGELLTSGHLTTTSITVTSIPTSGKTIYVRLFTLLNNVWQSVDYTFLAPPPLANTAKAVLTAPAGGPITTSPLTFQWSTGTGVTSYTLWVSAVKVGGYEVYNSPLMTTQSVTIPVPVNQRLYVRLYSMINGQQQFIDYVF